MAKIRKTLSFFLCALLLAGCAGSADSSVSSKAEGCGDDGTFGCAVDEISSKANVEDVFEPMTFQEAIDLFENGGGGLLYFGFPDCPWCKEVVPILQKEATEQGVKVHYIRTRDDDKELLYTDEQRTEIEPYLDEYMKEKDGELRLYVPLVAAVQNGKVLKAHQGTVDDHDAHEREMTDEEKAQVESDLAEIVSLARSE